MKKEHKYFLQEANTLIIPFTNHHNYLEFKLSLNIQRNLGRQLKKVYLELRLAIHWSNSFLCFQIDECLYPNGYLQDICRFKVYIGWHL